MSYYRPIVQTDPAARPEGAQRLAGGWTWFDRLERIERGGDRSLVAPEAVPPAILARLTAPRAAIAGVTVDRPRLMGIVNVTPDSFSDGGRFLAPDAAVAQARALVESGAAILDVGGESTRPGSGVVPAGEEIARTAPVIRALAACGIAAPLSIDTRKADVAREALTCGAGIVNDVAALSYDPEMISLLAGTGAALCLMHAQGDPATMQDAPCYDDVLLDVYDFLAERVARAEAAGIARARIVVDPGIGFGKTVAHNLALLRGLALFHGLGCVVLLGASRKRFIGTLGGGAADADADRRLPGTIAVTLAAIAQGVQLHRVHDIVELAQAVRLWRATTLGDET
ncbi:dihydropteroate synthase [Albidovulum sp.]|uniref:dihydropteroate synthase n=1 Tax=Albidovulum sp. TaxID=1872424 RepID=UPI00352916EF